MPLLPPADLFVIAGPCVVESLELCRTVARALVDATQRLGLPLVFKASFDKANRTSGASFRGPGVDEGLGVLAAIKKEFRVPVLTDVHESAQVLRVAETADVLQVPAFLARQTDLLLACGASGRAVNVKKGQFMAPAEMQHAVTKLAAAPEVWLCERGTFFGYGRLVNDMAGLRDLAALGKPVVFDATHSTQRPAGEGSRTGGDPTLAPILARAALATGCVHGLFVECHPDPSRALSDATSMLRLDEVAGVLEGCLRVVKALR